MRYSWILVRHSWTLLLWAPLLAADSAPHRYIVELTGVPVGVHVNNESKRTGKKIGLDSDLAETRRQQLRDEQKQAQTAIEALGGTVIDRTETVSNTLIVNMPDNLADKVRAIPGVKRVQKTRPVKMSLDHALPLHNVPQAWTALGGMGQAGAGIKIGMIDTGIDITQPGMQDSTLQIPAGFPKFNNASDVAYTNSKVIVARSYANLFQSPEPDPSAQDHDGHGTGTAMCAGGATNTGPYGPITGVAPKAWLGAYKIIGANGNSVDDSGIIKAVDDAVSDGMDVISMSVNGGITTRLSEDTEAQALANVIAMGVVVVVSAGNDEAFVNGNDLNTIKSPATALPVISAGASFSDRQWWPSAVSMPNGTAAPTLLGALPGSEDFDANGNPLPAVTGQLIDVFTLDQAGDACLPFPLKSMTGMIALIERTPNGCTFETKLDDVQAAGAVGAVLYNPPDHTLADFASAGGFGAGAATLPAIIIENADGLSLKQAVSANPALNVTLDMMNVSIPAPGAQNQITFFSARGPNVDGSIKPDLVAVGQDVYTATETTDTSAELYDPSGYIEGTSGTSYAAPLVAGTVALVKGFRPGLTSDQYRSLVINTAGPIAGTVMETGSGVLNAQAAVTSTFAVAPTNLSFNIGGASPNISTSLTISNVGSTAETYSLAVAPRNAGGAAPTLGSSSVTVQPGQTGMAPVTFTQSGLAPGAYEGYVTIRGSQSGVQERVPFWYGIASNTPFWITPTFVTGTDDGNTPGAGSRQGDAFEFRITDSSGIIVSNPQITVTPVVPTADQTAAGVVTGATVTPARDGTCCLSEDSAQPGVWSVSVRLAPRVGANLFQITAGNAAPVIIEIDSQ